MKRLIHIAAFALLLFVASAIRASDDGDRFSKFAGFDLRNNNFADVQAVLGRAPVRHVGDAGESEYSLCYLHKGKAVTFSSGELGGPDHQLLAFHLSSHPPSRRCATWPLKVPYSGEVGGIRLGMSQAEFAQALAHEVTWSGTNGEAVFQTQRQVGGNVFDVLVRVEGSFSAGKLLSFSVSRTETN